LAAERFDAGVYFNSLVFQDFYRLLDKWTGPEHAFSNLVVQAALRTLTKAVGTFLDGLVFNTFPMDKPGGYVGVPKDWRDTNPKKYSDAVKALNKQAKDVARAHAALIETARREIGI
jgi:hypothetical protein